MAPDGTRNQADLARRAIRLLEAFCIDHPGLQQVLLDRAFAGHGKDPRGQLDASAPPMTFAVDCVTTLLAYGCTDGHRHSLARLLEVVRDDFLGANPHPDFTELPRLLDAPCVLPSRAEERAYLERLLADIRRKADLYAPLRGALPASHPRPPRGLSRGPGTTWPRCAMCAVAAGQIASPRPGSSVTSCRPSIR